MEVIPENIKEDVIVESATPNKVKSQSNIFKKTLSNRSKKIKSVNSSSQNIKKNDEDFSMYSDSDEEDPDQEQNVVSESNKQIPYETTACLNFTSGVCDDWCYLVIRCRAGS